MSGSEMRHRPETAGHLAITRFARAQLVDTVEDVIALLRSDGLEALDLVIVVDDTGRYLGAVPFARLLTAAATARVGDLAVRDWPTVSAGMDQEQAVAAAVTTPSVAVPVINRSGEPIGVLTAKVLIEVLAAEHREDVDRLVGIMRDRAGAREALEAPPLQRFRRRLPWLLVGLGLSSGATAVMAGFEATLQQHVMIAFFIPAIVYLTDAIGTQTEAVAVRGLSARHQPLRAVLWSEVATGAMIGLALGAIAFTGIWLVFAAPAIGFGVAISIFAAGTLASAIGLMLPWVLSHFGVDPAFGAGPVATIVQDVLTIAVYFTVVTRIVGATG